MGILDYLKEPKLVGNVKRIKELHDLGLRDDKIVEKFEEHNINITENLVRVVVNGELDELGKKALPKKVVNEVREEIEVIFCDENMQPI